MYCGHCGHENSDEANYCGNCGKSLPSTTTSGTTAVQVHQPDRLARSPDHPTMSPMAGDLRQVEAVLFEARKLLRSDEFFWDFFGLGRALSEYEVHEKTKQLQVRLEERVMETYLEQKTVIGKHSVKELRTQLDLQLTEKVLTFIVRMMVRLQGVLAEEVGNLVKGRDDLTEEEKDDLRRRMVDFLFDGFIMPQTQRVFEKFSRESLGVEESEEADASLDDVFEELR